jgi:hypothetical protein
MPVLVGLLTMVSLAGCPEPTPDDVQTRVDVDRATYLKAEPIFAKTDQPVEVQVGKVIGDTFGWDRTEVGARTYARDKTEPPPAPSLDDVHRRVVATLDGLRKSGWRLLYTKCDVPDLEGQNPELAAEAEWTWIATGYKVAAGVSYSVYLHAVTNRTGVVSIDVVTRAPNHRDPADLFPDAPAGLARGENCAERATIGNRSESDGVDLSIGSQRSYPRSSHSADPRFR